MKHVGSAALRALLVSLMIVMPALAEARTGAQMMHVTAMLAFVAAILIFFEYWAEYPSLIAFRSAPPFNRLRFLGLFATILSLVVMGRQEAGAFLERLGHNVGKVLDFPFSPLHLMQQVAQGGAGTELLRAQAGLAIIFALATILVFVALVRIHDWPVHHGAFNFWVNLPLFNPTHGEDIVLRLRRNSYVNLILGILLPFVIPAALQLALSRGLPLDLGNAQSLIWVLSLWAFLPASLIMRAVALLRIADLIAQKRRHAHLQKRFQAV